MKVFYFTGTGNSLYVSKTLTTEILSIPQMLKHKTFDIKNEVVGFVFPVYGANIPKIVLEFLDKVCIESEYIFLIMTCSDDHSGATNLVCSKLKRKGINVDYSNVVYMPTNHIPMVNLEAELKIEKNVNEQLCIIKKDILSKRKYHIKNNIKYAIKRNAIVTAHKVLPIDKPSNFSITNNCINCKSCLYVCPRKNITSENDNILVGRNCEYCLSCVHNCPRKVISVKNDKSPNIRYRNLNVSLDEIKDSNNQY